MLTHSFNRPLTLFKHIHKNLRATAAHPSTSLALEVGTNLAYPAGSLPSCSLLSFSSKLGLQPETGETDQNIWLRMHFHSIVLKGDEKK